MIIETKFEIGQLVRFTGMLQDGKYVAWEGVEPGTVMRILRGEVWLWEYTRPHIHYDLAFIDSGIDRLSRIHEGYLSEYEEAA